jgi:hypothetical protein
MSPNIHPDLRNETEAADSNLPIGQNLEIGSRESEPISDYSTSSRKSRYSGQN